MCEEISFPRSEHKTLLLDYTRGLAISHFKSLSSIGRKMGHSQSSFSRMLSNTMVTTEELTGSRLNFIQNFLSNNGLEPKYIILDETVIERYGSKIENLGKYYSSTAEKVINSISLISSVLYVKNGLFFPLVTRERTKGDFTGQLISILEYSKLENNIVLVDGAIMCGRIFAKVVNSASTIIGRLRTNLKVVIDGKSFLLSKLKKKTKGVTSFIARVPSYQAKVKIVIDNSADETRIILCSDTNMTEYEILNHYSKRETVEEYFKQAKGLLGLKTQVYSQRSTEKHTELVALYFTAMMIARYYLNVKDRIGFREFIERQIEQYHLEKALFSLFALFVRDPESFFCFLSGFI
jgi:hypothetical protein